MNNMKMRCIVLLILNITFHMFAKDGVNIRVEIEIPFITSQELGENQQLLARELNPILSSYGLTFIKVPDFHITLVYIDKMSGDKYNDLQQALQKAAQQIEPIDDLYIESGPMVFGQQIPFLVFPLKRSKTLSQAIGIITKALRAKNIPVKQFRNFRPHISLGYIAVSNTRDLLNNIGSQKKFTYKKEVLEVGSGGLIPIIEKILKNVPIMGDEITADRLVISGDRPLRIQLGEKG